MTDQLIVTAVLGVMLIGLMTRRVSPTVGVVGALLSLFVLDVIGADEALGGFGSTAPATIAALYVVAGAVERSGALTPMSRAMLANHSPTSGMARLAVVVAGLSAFVANTPIVAMFIGPVTSWSRRKAVSPSRFLMPLSFAAILGGMLTLVGTSTNLLASDLVAAAGFEPFSLFEPAKIGLPVAVAGLAVITLFGPRVLADRVRVDNTISAQPFTVSLLVTDDAAIAGRTVAHAGLRELGAVYLVAVERNGEVTAPVDPNHSIRAGDVLTFAGDAGHVVELQSMSGLELVEGEQVLKLDDGEHAWFEAVIGSGSPLIGRTPKQTGFRSRYQAAVVAIRRDGAGIPGRLGETRLQVGDSLLLVADNGFRSRHRNRADFLLIQRRSEPPPSAAVHGKRSMAILVLVAILATTGFVGILKAAIIGAIATVVSGALTPRQARDSVDLNVVVLIAAAIGVGRAAESSGLAESLASALLDGFGWAGVLGAAFGLVIATVLLTELITNAGAVSLMIPIALRVGSDVDADPRLFALGIALAASASFLTPIGYQTNTMVYGPGGYRFTDYLRLGIPMTLLVLIVAPLTMAGSIVLW